MRNSKPGYKKQELKVLMIIFTFLLFHNIFIGLLLPPVTADSAPAGVILMAPTHGSYIKDTTPVLTWYPSFDADGDPLRYNVQVDELGGGWGSLVASSYTNFGITSWVISPPLQNGQTYQWRVRANDSLNQPNSTGQWSPTWYFTIDTISPSILSGSGNIVTYTDNSFDIYANFTDNTAVAVSTIYYKSEFDNSYQEQSMVQTTTNHFYISSQLLGINTTDDDEDYHYYVIAKDLAGNKFNYSQSGNNDFQITVLDIEPPDVITGTVSFQTTTDDEFSIYVNCHDNIGVADAYLYIRKLGDEFLKVKLNEYLPGYYLINYSGLKSDYGFNTSDGINCEYYIMIYDYSNNSYNYSDEILFLKQPWLIEVIDNDRPTILQGSGNMMVTTDDYFKIFVNFTDNVRVTTAELYIRDTTEPDPGWYQVEMVDYSLNNFEISYNDLKTDPQLKMNTSNGGSYEYYILGYDFKNNICNYSQIPSRAWNIIVQDNDAPIYISCSESFEVTTDDPFEIRASFIDNVNVSGVEIYLNKIEPSSGGAPRNAGRGDWLSTWMIKDEAGAIARFSISYDILKPELGLDTSNGGKIEYYFIVYDLAGNKNVFRAAGDMGWIITIKDNDPPVVLNATGDLSVTTNEIFTISIDLYENSGITDVIIYYGPVTPENPLETAEWSEFMMTISNDLFDSHIYECSATNLELGIDTVYNNLDYYYYIIAIDQNDNYVNIGTSTNPYKISIQDISAPIIESWEFAPQDLTADHNDDFIITVTISDIGGSGFHDQSVMLRYKRGSFDTIFTEYFNMWRIITEDNPNEDLIKESKITTKWQFAIPNPQLQEPDGGAREGWEIIASEYVSFEVLCRDIEGNIVESGLRTEYVNSMGMNHAPVVNLIAPNGDENYSKIQYIFWLATDLENSELIITIELSENNGETWTVIASGLENTGSYPLDTSELPNSGTYLIKITALDGELNGTDSSRAVFTIFNIEAQDSSGGLDGELKSTDTNLFNYLPIVIAGIIIAIIVASGAFIGGTEIGKYKFLTLVLVPLYSKLHHDEVLDHFVRGQIFGYIQANPGEHYNAIKESLELNNGTLSHHLKILEKEEYIYSKRDGFYSRFYPKGMKITPMDAAQLNKIQKIIVNKVHERPGMSQHKIVALLGASQQVISYNLTKLARDNVLRIDKQGREKRYYVNHTEMPVPQVQSLPIAQPVVQTQQVNVTASKAPPTQTTVEAAKSAVNLSNSSKSQ